MSLSCACNNETASLLSWLKNEYSCPDDATAVDDDFRFVVVFFFVLDLILSVGKEASACCDATLLFFFSFLVDADFLFPGDASCALSAIPKSRSRSK